MCYKSVLLVFVFSTGFPLISMSAGERIPAGGRAGAMGGASVAVSDFWSASNNPAGTAWLKGFSAGISFENRFLMKELSFQQGAIIYAVKPGSFALSVSHFGTSGYQEFHTGISYSRKFGRSFSTGIQLDYLRLGMPEDYGSKNLISCEIGLQFKPTDRLLAGILIANPVPVKVTWNPVEYLPVTFCAGISYRFSENFMAVVEAEKELTRALVIRIGAEYQIAGRFSIRAGLGTNPWIVTFGMGIKIGRLTLDIASGYHQELGFSPGGSLLYQTYGGTTGAIRSSGSRNVHSKE